MPRPDLPRGELSAGVAAASCPAWVPSLGPNALHAQPRPAAALLLELAQPGL